MRILFIDDETTYQVDDKRDTDNTPYHPDNYLVSVGFEAYDTDTKVSRSDYLCFKHSTEPATGNAYDYLQEELDEADLVVAHNLKFDLEWLLECGFRYDGDVYCTMLAEYVLARGRKIPFDLDSCCECREVEGKDKEGKDLIGNTPTELISWPILEKYGRQDVAALKELYLKQQELFFDPENAVLLPTIKLVNEFSLVLIEMERNGVQVDLEELDKVEKEFTEEYDQIIARLNKLTYIVMGDTPINLESPEQLCNVVYSRKVLDKKTWATKFNIGVEERNSVKKQRRKTKHSNTAFKQAVREGTEILYKTKARQCENCEGVGGTQELKKDGTPRKRLTKCEKCLGSGVIYEKSGVVAGLKLAPASYEDVTANGFATDHSTLERLIQRPNISDIAKEYCSLLIRKNKLSTYINTFIAGIRKYTRPDGRIHPQYLQFIAATGRLSSVKPNLQNQPREHTFPIRRVFKSRFKGGKLCDPDAAQLEYRTAVFLAQDKAGMEDIKNGVDAHKVTADIIGCSRQVAKAHTFKPLYGGSSGTQAEQKYYKFFLKKHQDIAEWHDRLIEEAISNKRITLPSGRQYDFPHCKRTPWGCTFQTQIKNYPVQGFATADIIPIVAIEVYRLLKLHECKSLMCLTTHDDIVVDMHPEEFDSVPKLIYNGFNRVVMSLKERYNIDFNVPLSVEIKAGPNLMEMEVIEI